MADESGEAASWRGILRDFVAETAKGLAAALKWGFVLVVLGAAFWLIDLATQTTDEHGKRSGGLIAWVGSITKLTATTEGLTLERQVQQEQTRQIEQRSKELEELQAKFAALQLKVAALEQVGGPGGGEPARGPASGVPETATVLPPLESTTRIDVGGQALLLPPKRVVTDTDVRLEELKVAQKLVVDLPSKGVLDCGIRLPDGNIEQPLRVVTDRNVTVSTPADLRVGAKYRLTGNVSLFDDRPRPGVPPTAIRALPAGSRFTVDAAPNYSPLVTVESKAGRMVYEGCTIAVTLDYVPRLTDLAPVQQKR